MRGSSFDPYSVFIYYQYISDKNSLSVLPSFTCYTPSHIIIAKAHGLSLESSQSVYPQREGNSSPYQGYSLVSPLKLWLRAIFCCRVLYIHFPFLPQETSIDLYIFSFLLFLYNFLLHFSPYKPFHIFSLLSFNLMAFLLLIVVMCIYIYTHIYF